MCGIQSMLSIIHLDCPHICTMMCTSCNHPIIIINQTEQPLLLWAAFHNQVQQEAGYVQEPSLTNKVVGARVEVESTTE